MEKRIEDPPTYTTTTFAAVSKIRGFTVTLLYVLEGKCMRTCEVAETTGKTNAYVGRYLQNMRKYSLVEKRGFFWELTPFGRFLLNYFKEFEKTKENLKNRIYTIVYKSRKINERIKKESRKIDESCVTKKSKQLSIRLWLQNSHRSIDDAEAKVVEVLLDHYNKTGSKFIFVSPPDMYAVAERFNITPIQAEYALRNLYQDRIVYHRYDRQHNAIKLGLYKAFIEKLKLTAKQGRCDLG